MSRKPKNDYFSTLALRYKKASRKQKSLILKEFCATAGYHIKHAIRKLNAFKFTRRTRFKKKRGPKSQYNFPEILKPLQEIWLAANLPCSKRLKAILPVWISSYQLEFGFLAAWVFEKLEKISASTLDRILRPFRIQHTGTGRSTTKPGLLLKHHIPIKTNQWDESRPDTLKPTPSPIAALPWPDNSSLPLIRLTLPRDGPNNAPSLG